MVGGLVTSFEDTVTHWRGNKKMGPTHPILTSKITHVYFAVFPRFSIKHHTLVEQHTF